MVVNAKEIYTRREKENIEETNKLEKVIDNFLEKQSSEQGETLRFALDIETKVFVLNRLTETYRNAGWEVKLWESSSPDKYMLMFNYPLPLK